MEKLYVGIFIVMIVGTLVWQAYSAYRVWFPSKKERMKLAAMYRKECKRIDALRKNSTAPKASLTLVSKK